VITSGKLFVSSASIDKAKEFTTKNDIVIVANRKEAQAAAIEAGAQCLVIGMEQK
jgi:predicted transcriptional regulator